MSHICNIVTDLSQDSRADEGNRLPVRESQGDKIGPTSLTGFSVVAGAVTMVAYQ